MGVKREGTDVRRPDRLTNRREGDGYLLRKGSFMKVSIILGDRRELEGGGTGEVRTVEPSDRDRRETRIETEVNDPPLFTLSSVSARRRRHEPAEASDEWPLPPVASHTVRTGSGKTSG
eukprot:s425_g17.t1